MAGLNYTIVVWFLGPATLGAGQSVEYTFTYPGGNVVSFNSLDTSTALNQKFSYETTGIVTQGPSEDDPPDDTIFFFTVSNEGDSEGEFFFVLQAIYT